MQNSLFASPKFKIIEIDSVATAPSTIRSPTFAKVKGIILSIDLIK